MKKGTIAIILCIFLTGFISAGITGSVASGVQNQATATNVQTNNSTTEIQTQTQSTTAIREAIKNKIQIKNRINAIASGEECPEMCRCDGSSTKCQLQNGREMTITAGNSGNIIVQVKQQQMRTKVELYKAEGKIYGVFSGNRTKEIKLLPDQIREKIQERLRLKNCSCETELDDDGNYQVQTEKRARLFGVIPVRERVRVEMNSETGEITRTRTSWWGFLAKDTNEEEIVGASCGTVTPGQNDACCQNKNYDYWNSEKGECLFNSEE